MIFLICIFPKEQIFNRAGLWRHLLNRESLRWNHVKNLFQLKAIVYGIGEIKKRVLKQNVNSTIYPTVQHNKCVICSKLIMSQFLSILEVRKMVVGCALVPGNSILHTRQEELTIYHHLSPLKLLSGLLSLFQQLKCLKKS